ncbi:MAG: hypothetical protein LLG13_18710 [Bacteroidales bacterium]|nr:hypothetical protein [Bacteroidales bacterium]
MRTIGGYFELELREGKEYHNGAVCLNTGRNAFEYLLKAKGFKKVFLPYYTCDVMLQPIKRQGVEYKFYHLDKNLVPILGEKKFHNDEVIIYNNYFGLFDKVIRIMAERYKRNIVIDNSQAFYALPLSGIDTFYSPRKFFGVPDGAYLYTENKLDSIIERDRSAERIGHLIYRIDSCAEDGFLVFQKNEKSLSGSGIKSMSLLTKRLLQNIDYQKCAEVRKENFNFLHSELVTINHFDIDLANDSVPMVYPLLTDKCGLRDFLISKNIYVATYWDSVRKYINHKSYEYKLVTNLVPLPIDQRYDTKTMELIVKAVLSYV